MTSTSCGSQSPYAEKLLMLMRRANLPLLAVLTAVAYGVGLTGDSKLVSIALKMAPALAMALFTWCEASPRRGAITLALVLHAAGDGLLDMGRAWLLAGMGMFFLGHLAYIAAFLPYLFPRNELPAWRRAAIAAVGVAMAAIVVQLWPELPGVMRFAVPAYTLSLGAMVAAALGGRWRGPLVIIGALLFVVSDALLGLRLFGGSQSLSFLVWPTYVAAQIFMGIGYVRMAPGVRPPG